MPPVGRRMSTDTKGEMQLKTFEEKSVVETYYQVLIGSYGVVLPKMLNVDTLDGLQLLEGKATAVTDRNLASRIAEKSGGKLCEVTEKFVRNIKEIESSD